MKGRIRVEFDGYWLERYQSDIPQGGGIYCVYACEPIARDRIVVLREILYIGESDDVKMSVAMCEEVAAWKAYLKAGEELCYSFARMEGGYRHDALAAMVLHHKPPCNDVEEKAPENISLMIVGEHELLYDLIVIGNA